MPSPHTHIDYNMHLSTPELGIGEGCVINRRLFFVLRLQDGNRQGYQLID